MAKTIEAEPAKRPASLAIILLFSVFVVATCGLIYELLAGTLASYLLGDSVTQFSTVIGSYLFAMGVGSWCSRYVKKNEIGIFVRVEILIALIGGSLAAILFLLFPLIDHFRIALYGLVLIIGILVGLEIPLLIRILRHRFAFAELVSTVLTYDYVGALAASLLFPLVLVPYLGLMRTGFAFGIANVAVALALIWVLRREAALWAERIAAIIVTLLLVVGFVASDRLQRWAEVASYAEPVIYARSTPYQRIVLTRNGRDLRLFLNGNLQFSSRDEYRYHEALVWPALGRVVQPRNVLILGGGDGFAAREVLRHAGVERITLVDLDPAMTQMFRSMPMLSALNRGALSSPKLHVVNADAFRWIRAARQSYDVIIVDFPDPTDFSIGKLYTESFYRELRRVLAPDGVMTIQSTSPLIAPRAYWTVAATLEAAGLSTRGYHAYVPSFGEWGFTLAAHRPLAEAVALPKDNRFLTQEAARASLDFPPDMARPQVEANRLDNQALVREFAEEWSRYEG
jgi:spermidine synthase